MQAVGDDPLVAGLHHVRRDRYARQRRRPAGRGRRDARLSLEKGTDDGVAGQAELLPVPRILSDGVRLDKPLV